MALSPDGTKLAVVATEGLSIVGRTWRRRSMTPTTSSPAGYDYFDIAAVATERSRTDLPRRARLAWPSRPGSSPSRRTVPACAPIVRTDALGARRSPPCHRTGPRSPIRSRRTDQREIHVVDVETGVDRRVAFDGAVADVRPQWSPDGTKLVFERSAVAWLPADGRIRRRAGQSRRSVRRGPTTTGGADVRFSPDGSRILAFYNADRTTWVLDPRAVPAPSSTTPPSRPPTWQRLAP